MAMHEASEAIRRMEHEQQDHRDLIERTRPKAIAALRHLSKAINGNPGTGQRRRLTAFIGGIYNGPRYLFDMSDLRGLDVDLQESCLAMLIFDRLGHQEIHTLGVVTGQQIYDWLVEDGHAHRAEKRQIGNELYRARYGEKGHPSEPE